MCVCIDMRRLDPQIQDEKKLAPLFSEKTSADENFVPIAESFEGKFATLKKLDVISDDLLSMLGELYMDNPSVQLEHVLELKSTERLTIDALMVWLFIDIMDRIQKNLLYRAFVALMTNTLTKNAHPPVTLLILDRNGSATRNNEWSKNAPPPPLLGTIGKSVPPALPGSRIPSSPAGPPPMTGSTGKAPTSALLGSMGKVGPPSLPRIMATPTGLATTSGGKIAPPTLPGGKVAPPTLSGGKVAPPTVPGGKSGPPPMLAGKSAPSLLVGKCAPNTLVGKSAPPMLIGKSSPPMLVGKSAAPPPVETVSAKVFKVPSLPSEVGEVRKMHWQSIPLPRFENSLFSRLPGDCGYSIDFDLVQRHFTKRRQVDNPATSSPVSVSVVASVLEQKRVQQIEIFLNGNKGFNIEAIVSILQGRHAHTDERWKCETIALLEALLQIYPTNEEVELLKTIEQNSSLPKADEFLKNLIQIPIFKYSVWINIIVLQINDSIFELLNYFNKFNKFISTLLNSEKIPILFQLIGTLVVYLTGASSSKTFHGFTLDQIGSLRKVHSFIDKPVSALHVIVSNDNDQLANAIAQLLAPVEELIEYDFSEMLIRTTEVETNWNALCANRSLQATNRTTLVGIPFYSALCTKIETLVNKTRPQFEQLISLKNETNEKKFREYFAETDKKPINEMLSALFTLKKDLQIASNYPPNSASKRLVASTP